MAWIRAMGAPATARKYVYDEGTIVESIGSSGYSYGSDTVVSPTFNADNIALVSGGSNRSAICGTLSTLDMTSYNKVKFSIKTNSNAAVLIVVASAKTLGVSATHQSSKVLSAQTADYVEQELDVSALTSNSYIAVVAPNNASVNVTAIWLE